MLLLALCAASLAGVWGEEQTIPKECDMKFFTHYKEFGCKPVFGSGPCPVKFNCESLSSRGTDKCYFNGSEYSVGENIGDVHSACQAACFCRQGEGRADITCAQNECPENLGADPRRQGCRLQHEEGGCCSVSHICPNETASFKGATCEYEGKTLFEGEKFYPDEGCKVCLCKAGFNGTLGEPWCRDVYCGMELHQMSRSLVRGCTPVYYKDGCCPIDYRCPEDKDVVLPGPPEDSSRTDEGKCLFGSLQLSVNDKLSGSDSCVDCSCRIPPLLTCVHTC